MSRNSDNADERREQVERVLQRADRQDPDRRNRERRATEQRRKAERRGATAPKKK
jgi:hypothetical protein